MANRDELVETGDDQAGPSGEGTLSEKDQDLKELMDLQRKYRMMMGDRKAFDKHAKSKLRQQNATLSRLQTENESIKKELGTGAQGDKQNLDSGSSAEPSQRRGGAAHQEDHT